MTVYLALSTGRVYDESMTTNRTETYVLQAEHPTLGVKFCGEFASWEAAFEQAHLCMSLVSDNPWSYVIITPSFPAPDPADRVEHGPCIVIPDRDGPTLWDCKCSECRSIRRGY